MFDYLEIRDDLRKALLSVTGRVRVQVNAFTGLDDERRLDLWFTAHVSSDFPLQDLRWDPDDKSTWNRYWGAVEVLGDQTPEEYVMLLVTTNEEIRQFNYHFFDDNGELLGTFYV